MDLQSQKERRKTGIQRGLDWNGMENKQKDKEELGEM